MSKRNRNSIDYQEFRDDVTFYMCGIKLRGVRPENLFRELKSGIKLESGSCCIRFVNAYSLSVSERQEGYKDVLNGPGINVPDSATIVKLAKLTFPRIGKNVTQLRGTNFLRYVLANSEKEIRHVFLGANSATLTMLQDNLEENFPAANLGEFIPLPYSEDIDFLIKNIMNLYRPRQNDIIWIGLGTPKQDLISSRLSAMLNKPAIGVGAAFDFLSGRISEAPQFIIKLNLEWLYRLITEPKRLWKRYLIENVHFLLVWLRMLQRDIRQTKDRK